jgi:hypothetical protein
MAWNFSLATLCCSSRYAQNWESKDATAVSVTVTAVEAEERDSNRNTVTITLRVA